MNGWRGFELVGGPDGTASIMYSTGLRVVYSVADLLEISGEGWTVGELADRLGYTRGAIRNSLRRLKADGDAYVVRRRPILGGYENVWQAVNS